ASVTSPGILALVKDVRRSSMDYVGGGGGDGPDPAARAAARAPSGGQGGAQGAPAAAPAAPPARQGCGEIGPQGLPLVKPPWGRITAIDLNTGERVWTAANGETPDCVKNHPLLAGVNIPRTGKPDRGGRSEERRVGKGWRTRWGG